MILLSHLTASATARHAALALERAGVLGEIWTCSGSSCGPHRFPIPAETPTLSHTTTRLGLARPPEPSSHYAACRSLDRLVSTRVTSAPFRGVYAFEHGAEATFRSAAQRGLLRIYELARGHWRVTSRLRQEEAELQPAWAATLSEEDSPAHAHTRTDVELAHAELVIVPSTFILHTLEPISDLSATIALLLPGASSLATPPPVRPFASSRKLRAVFAGPLTQSRGLSYLFRACRELRSIVDLTVVGDLPESSCAALDRELASVEWISARSTGEIRAALAQQDVLISPAIIDDFDPILLEAMAAGLPIIATPHTAAPDLIDDGTEGFIVPIRSAAEIAARLELLHRFPERREFMSLCARRRVEQHTWESYERTLAAGVATALARR